MKLIIQKELDKFYLRSRYPDLVYKPLPNPNRKIRVDGVLLFGSFARGKPTKHSDVDLVVISKDFSKNILLSLF